MTTLECNACGSTDLSFETVTCTIQKWLGKTCDFVICSCCGYAGNPGNTHDYRCAPFDPGSQPETSVRAGDGVTPRREYRMAEMGIEILQNHFGKAFAPDVVVYGAGLSQDHVLIQQQLPVSRVAVSDLGNFQEAQDFVPFDSREAEFDLMVACEVVEHFTDLDEDFANLLHKVRDSGLVIASTNLRDGLPLETVTYPFEEGHTSDYSGRSLIEIGRRFGVKVDFRTPAIALKMSTGGPRKRYVFFYRDPAIGECISQYFADHHLAPSE